MNILGDRIKHLRKLSGLTREDLSEKLGISIHTLAKYEQSQREPDICTLNEIADYFNVTTDYLTGRSDSKQNEFKEFFTKEEIDILSNLSVEKQKFIIEEINALKNYIFSLIETTEFTEDILTNFQIMITLLYTFFSNLKLKSLQFESDLNIKIKSDLYKFKSYEELLESLKRNNLVSEKNFLLNNDISEILNQLQSIQSNFISHANRYALLSILKSFCVNNDLIKKDY